MYSRCSLFLSAEVSSIYSKNNKVRKIHNLIYAPDFKTAAKINSELDKIGNLRSDGRPILGLDAKELLKIVLDSGYDTVVYTCSCLDASFLYVWIRFRF